MTDLTASVASPMANRADEPVAAPVTSLSPALRRPKKKIRWVEAIVLHIFFIAIALFFLAPFVWMFLAAFETHADPFIAWPKALTFNNFTYIFRELDFARNLWNSIFVSVTSMIVTTFTVALAGYSLSRIEFKQKNWASYSILLLQTMPLSATMVPIYSLARELGLRNSYFGLILVSVALDLPLPHVADEGVLRCRSEITGRGSLDRRALQAASLVRDRLAVGATGAGRRGRSVLLGRLG